MSINQIRAKMLRESKLLRVAYYFPFIAAPIAGLLVIAIILFS